MLGSKCLTGEPPALQKNPAGGLGGVFFDPSAERVWKDMLAEGLSCGLHRIERLMRLQALKARPRRRCLPPDLGERQATAVAPNVLDRTFDAPC